MALIVGCLKSRLSSIEVTVDEVVPTQIVQIGDPLGCGKI